MPLVVSYKITIVRVIKMECFPAGYRKTVPTMTEANHTKREEDGTGRGGGRENRGNKFLRGTNLSDGLIILDTKLTAQTLAKCPSFPLAGP